MDSAGAIANVAGVGLVLAMVTLRRVLRTPLRRSDGLVVAAVPMLLILGWRSVSSPVGPLTLLLVATALLASRVQPHAPAA